jgi:hypothetical protein
MGPRSYPWIVVGDGEAPGECLRCGAVLGISLPMPMEMWVAAAKAFVKIHAKCKKVKV